MNIIHALILAVTQGITEFLPISSSGHLVLFPWFLKFKDPGLAFSVFLHLGTTISIIVYFYKDLLEIFLAVLKGLLRLPRLLHSLAMTGFKDEIAAQPMIARNDKLWSKKAKFGFLIIAACIPAGILGFFFDDYFETVFRSPFIIAINLIVFGLIMWAAEYKSKKTDNINDITLRTAIIIGLAQSFALMPGASRSGITIAFGLICGLKREVSAKFSFLMSTPIILGASLLKLKDLRHVNSELLLPYILGFFVSFIVGYFSIKFLLSFFKTHKLNVFVWYRLILGLVIILMVFNY